MGYYCMVLMWLSRYMYMYLVIFLHMYILYMYIDFVSALFVQYYEANNHRMLNYQLYIHVYRW